jgi:hypothetical protein
MGDHGKVPTIPVGIRLDRGILRRGILGWRILGWNILDWLDLGWLDALTPGCE